VSYAVKLVRNTPPASLNDDRAPAVRRISGVTPITDPAYDTAGFSLQSALAVFPPDQFEQILYVFNDITPKETRGMAVLALCRNYLTTMPGAMKKLSKTLSSHPSAKMIAQ
jgi:hypothetical protein